MGKGRDRRRKASAKRQAAQPPVRLCDLCGHPDTEHDASGCKCLVSSSLSSFASLTRLTSCQCQGFVRLEQLRAMNPEQLAEARQLARQKFGQGGG